MPPYIQTLVRAALKIGAGYLISKGFTDDSHAQELIGAVMGLVGIIWGLFHRSGVLQPDAGVTVPVKQTGFGGGAALLLLFVFSLALLFLAAGCRSNPSKAHVVRGIGTGTSLGITQNPTTGSYELGVKRCQVELTTIPVFAQTNKDGSITFSVPEVNSRYEVSTHSAIFGNASLTSTLSTGSNAVQTALGGATPPINTGVGVGSNLTPQVPR